MGHASALGIRPSIVPAEALAGDVVTKVIWPRIGDAPSAPSAATAFVAPPPPAPRETTASATAIEVVDASADGAPAPDAPDVDGAQVATLLRGERLAVNGGFGHPHANSGCGFCRRAAGAYR